MIVETKYGFVTLPDSVSKVMYDREYRGTLKDGTLVHATVRWGEEIRGSQKSFAITGHTAFSCECIHEEIAEAIPQLAPLLKYHLMGPEGPMHYLANTLFLASAKDCWGGVKGEQRKTPKGELMWRPRVFLNDAPLRSSDTYYGEKDAANFRFELEPILHEGKERELEGARRAAVWPEATDEELCLPEPELARLLLNRLPALMEEFKAQVEALGFVY